jgi:hypothetical protein
MAIIFFIDLLLFIIIKIINFKFEAIILVNY